MDPEEAAHQRRLRERQKMEEREYEADRRAEMQRQREFNLKQQKIKHEYQKTQHSSRSSVAESRRLIREEEAARERQFKEHMIAVSIQNSKQQRELKAAESQRRKEEAAERRRTGEPSIHKLMRDRRLAKEREEREALRKQYLAEVRPKRLSPTHTSAHAYKRQIISRRPMQPSVRVHFLIEQCVCL